MSVFVYVCCPACDWKSNTWYGGQGGRMMGVNTAGNNAEDEFDAHFHAEHMAKRAGASGGR